MKRYFALTLIIIVALTACQTGTNREKKIKSASLPQRKISSVDSVPNPKTLPKNDCTRGKAVPIVKKSVFPNTHFQLQADSLTAFETVDLDDSDHLIIHNYGCEYYILTFRFETLRFKDDTNHYSAWYKNAASLVWRVSKGIDAPIEIRRGLDTLINFIDEYKNYKKLIPGTEIDFGDHDINNPIREFITLDRIEKLDAKKYAIEITFSEGPL